MTFHLSVSSPIGDLILSEQAGAIVGLDWDRRSEQRPTPLLKRAREQIDAYFAGDLRVFDLPLRPTGSAYRQKIWQQLAVIPYGQVIGYAALAANGGGSARSAGSACGANPLPILIPCHRVVGVAGLCGYSGGGGLDTKAWLLRWEARNAIHQIAA